MDKNLSLNFSFIFTRNEVGIHLDSYQFLSATWIPPGFQRFHPKRWGRVKYCSEVHVRSFRRRFLLILTFKFPLFGTPFFGVLIPQMSPLQRRILPILSFPLLQEIFQAGKRLLTLPDFPGMSSALKSGPVPVLGSSGLGPWPDRS